MDGFSKERWADIPGYEGAYQVSDYGRVRSCDRYLNAMHGSKQFRKGILIKPIVMPNGYVIVGLNRDLKKTTKYIHRLVAESFLPNPQGLKEVNHKDEDKTNNRVDNLEWCTHLYNINYGSAKSRISVSHLSGGFGKKPIAQIKDGVVVKQFNSAADAERETGIDASAIRKVCLKRPRFKTAGGYEWINI